MAADFALPLDSCSFITFSSRIEIGRKIRKELVGMDIQTRRRGFDPEDNRWFSRMEVERMRSAQHEIRFLLDRGFGMESIITFIGNHYQFSMRQRTALRRATSSTLQQAERSSKNLPLAMIPDGPIEIDGFNLLITLETALSGSPILACDDGVFRDLAGLRGTYSLIAQTDIALGLIFDSLTRLFAPQVTFFLDAPVSNSGRLRERILQLAQSFAIPVEVRLVPDADKVLTGHDRIATGDSVLLDSCRNWFNLTEHLLREQVKDAWIIDLEGY